MAEANIIPHNPVKMLMKGYPLRRPFFYHKYGLKIISKEDERIHYSRIGGGRREGAQRVTCKTGSIQW